MMAGSLGNHSGKSVTEFPVQLDRGSATSLPVQLAGALREAIDAATLRPGDAVPATRELARRVGVARGVVVAAYEQLIAEGYLVAQHGRGTAVHPELGAVLIDDQVASDAARNAAENETVGAADPAGREFVGRVETVLDADELAATGETSAVLPLRPGQPIPSAIDSAAWRAAWRNAAMQALQVAPPLGDPLLREEIADHLRRMRATARSAGDVFVTAGTRDGLGLLLTALRTLRGRSLVVGVEDPGLPSLRGVAERHGATIVALATDAEGLDTTRLPERTGGLETPALDIVIVTPSHQYPLGGSLPLVRRRELLTWARRSDVVIVEDDFDSELRYTGSPLPALAALDDPLHGSVVLLGTFSRTIAPALAAGYLLAPRNIRAKLEPVRHELGGPVSSIVQSALARYLAGGELRRNTTRLLRRYADRRDLVSERLAGVPGVRVRPMDGGLHAVLEFVGADADLLRAREAAAVSAANEADLGAQPLGGYWQRSGAGMAGIVIGMGGSDDAEFDAALANLADILRQI